MPKPPADAPDHVTTRSISMNRRPDAITPGFRDILLLIVCRPHRLVAIGWWRLCGKRLRAKYRLEAAVAALPFAHERGIEAKGKRDLAAISALTAAEGAEALAAPAICVHLHIADEDARADARHSAASALKQSFAPRRLIVTASEPLPRAVDGDRVEHVATPYASRIAGLHAALKIAQDAGAAYLVPLAADALLPPHALAAYAADRAAAHVPDGPLPVLYGDQDEIGGPGRKRGAWLKPEWDPRMLLSQDYIGAACALPVDAALACLERAEEPPVRSLYELILHLTLEDEATPVRHIPRITARTAAGAWRRSDRCRATAVDHFVGPQAHAIEGPFGAVEILWPLPAPAPKVSVIVATRDKVELLRTCVDGLLHGTDYPDFEVVIADNDSRQAETLRYMDAVVADPRVSVVRWPHPFNYSAINNFAAGHASGRFLCLLNNDVEIIEPSWLSELIREALRPGIGAVGARLLYPDRSIQHAGVAVGLGNAAGHAHRALPDGEPGYFAQAHIARGVSAVTGACLLVAKRHFDAVGGLDEESLSVAYNDVDLCLKLRELGLTNIYAPRATLIHHESKSRGLDFSAEHLDRYMRELAVLQDRWHTARIVDPWHHAELDRGSETYVPTGAVPANSRLPG